MKPLGAELRRLWLVGGRPSVREIAKRSRGRISHATAGKVLAGDSARWESVEAVCVALGGDVDRVRGLFMEQVEGEVRRDEAVQAHRFDARTEAIDRLAAAIEHLAAAIELHAPSRQAARDPGETPLLKPIS